MKIGFVLDDTLDSADGVQQYVLTLGHWLSKHGHDVHYIVGETKRVDINNVHSLARNVRVRFNKNRMSIPLPAHRVDLVEVLEREQFDVLHIQMPYSPQLGAKVIKYAPENTAIVGTFHILPFGRSVQLGTRLLAKATVATTSKIDTIMSVSAPAAVFARQTYGRDSLVIPNAVLLPKFRPSSHAKTSVVKIVFVGRLMKRKGVIELIKAVSKLATSKDYVVTIIGKGPLESRAKKLVSQYGLDNVVKFLGFVSEQEKFQQLANADIAVFPSLGGESFGIVLIEAMAAGAGVVVGGNNDGYRSVLKDDEVLFNAVDSNEFSQCLSRFIDDTQLRRVIHRKQQEQVSQYLVDQVAPRILEVYKDLIAKHKQNKDNIVR